jgi:hypothetical protein
VLAPVWSAAAQTAPHAAAQPQILGDLVDVSEEFAQPDQVHFVASRGAAAALRRHSQRLRRCHLLRCR